MPPGQSWVARFTLHIKETNTFVDARYIRIPFPIIVMDFSGGQAFGTLPENPAVRVCTML